MSVGGQAPYRAHSLLLCRGDDMEAMGGLTLVEQLPL